MHDREQESRAKARLMSLREVLEEYDRPEEQYQCSVCKVFRYLIRTTACDLGKVAEDLAHGALVLFFGTIVLFDDFS